MKKAATGESKRLSIAHDPLKCLSTEARALVDARVLPGKEMEKSFVYFRAAGTEDFYYVVMRPRTAEDVVAELPRPLPGIRGIDYFVQALDRESYPKRTPEYAPPVTDTTVCRDERAGPPPSRGRRRRGRADDRPDARGAGPVPPGFNKDDVAKVILVTGAVVALSVALAPSGTGAARGRGRGGAIRAGLSTGAIVGIGAGVVAAGSWSRRRRAAAATTRPRTAIRPSARRP